MQPFIRAVNNFHIFLFNAKSFWQNIFIYSYVKVYFAALVVINAALWLAARFIGGGAGDGPITLHYNVDFGVDLIGGAARIYIIPLTGLFVIFLNFTLFGYVSLHKDRKLVSHILFSASLVANFLLCAAIASIYLANFR